MRKAKENFSNKSREINLAPGFSDNVGQRLIRQKKLRQKLGDVSAMWLFRHRNELPEPMRIAGRRFWREEEVDAFIEKLSTARKANDPPCSGSTP